MPDAPTSLSIIMLYARDNIDNKYNAFSHLYFSAHPYVFYHMILLFVIKTFLFCGSFIIFYHVWLFFLYLVLYHLIKGNEKLPSMILYQILIMNLPDLKYRLIITILLRLYLVSKTGYYPLCITTLE